MSENNLTQNNGLDVALLQQQFRQNGLGEVLNPADNVKLVIINTRCD